LGDDKCPTRRLHVSKRNFKKHFSAFYSLSLLLTDDGCGLAQLLCLLWRKEVSWILE